ncbi:MAG TPA: GNVR domain-containing protein [Magnetospirillaceae bacterium]
MPQPTPTMADTLRKVWRHRGIVIWGTLCTAVVVAVVVKMLPASYVAEAQVLVSEPDGPKLFKDEPNTPPSMMGNSDDRVQSERYVVLSRPVAQKVVDSLGLTKDPEFNAELVKHGPSLGSLLAQLLSRPATGGQVTGPSTGDRVEAHTVDALIGKTDVAVLGRSNVLSVDVHSKDPDKAAQLANAIATTYVSATRDSKMQTTGDLESFMESRIGDLRKQVEQAEQAAEDYRRQNNLYVGETSGIANQQLTEMNTQLTEAETAKAEADAKLQEAQAAQHSVAGNGGVPAVLASPLITALKQQEADAQRHLAELSANYGDKHPDVINARAQIRDIQRKIQVEMNGIIAGLQHEAHTADAHYSTLTHDFGKTQHEMGGVNDKTIHLEALQRDATVYRNLLEAMLNHEKEISWQRELEQSDARVISSATAPERSTLPKSLIVLLGTLAGGILSMMAALMVDGVDRTFRQYEDLEAATGLPVVALVPNQRNGSAASQVLRKPVSAYSEALRRIYVGIQMMDVEEAPKTVLFCSATPQEGKSVLIASLGRLLASNGKRVLLIDCDWRSPNLHRQFRISNKGGLATLLTDNTVNLEDCIKRDSLSGLDVVPAGFWDSKDLPALTSERMRQLLETFGKNYDLVLLDAAPVLVGAEVLMLSRMVEKVMFVVRWGHTRRDAVFEALRQVVDARGDLGGLVLSRVDSKRYRQYARGPLNYDYVRPAAGPVG